MAFPDVSFEVVDLTESLGAISNSALIQGDEQTDVGLEHATKSGLPASFVPNRNATFLTLSHAYAQKLGAKYVMTGVCETDYSGYPDCRSEFIQSLAHTLNIGSQSNITILTPLMHITKAETFELAEKVGVLSIVVHYSHTCYNGSEIFNEWGHGCGHCPACMLRKAGYEEFISKS
jgi:7-cyano-7-deazaguanine synthase